MSIEAMKLALEALASYMSATDDEEDAKAHNLMVKAFFELKQAIEQAEQAQKPEGHQEPVAWITQGGKGWLRWHKSYDDNKDSVPLYTSSPKRQPLTDEEVESIVVNARVGEHGIGHTIARAIEAAHGIKE